MLTARPLRRAAPIPLNGASAPAAEERPPASLAAGPAPDPAALPAEHVHLFRRTDTAAVLLVLGLAFLATNHREIANFEHFLALRITVKNALLFLGFVVLWHGITSATSAPSVWAGCTRHRELAQVSAGCTLAALLAAFAPLTGLSRSFGLSAVLLFWVTSVPAALVARRVACLTAGAIARATRPRQVIIVGSGPLAYAAFRSACECPERRYDVLGFVDTNSHITQPEIRARHLGELRELERILMHRHVDLVVIALPVKSQYSSIEAAIRTCERVGVESRYLADIFRGELAHHEYADEAGIPAVAMKVVQSDVRTAVKRGFDVIAAALALILLAPLLAGIAIAIRLTGPGPILFAQERYGLNRRVFRMYKFRTMVPDAEALQTTLEHLNEAAGPVFKIRDDPRVTPLGGFLRRTSLDELPQLFNVVTGDMSLVGPRPLPLRDVRHFTHGALMRRFSVRPGITGLWQVSGRCDLPFDTWITLDLRYIDQWSLGLDARILVRTIPAVLRGPGAC